MCNIAWCSFSWEAFAGILAGFLAVSGAVAVGLRQQKILENQTRVELLKVRVETFDKRWEVYEDVVAWLRDHWQSGESPTGTVESDFIRAIEKAKFLFRPAVPEQLEKWRRTMIKLHYAKGRLQQIAPGNKEWQKFENMVTDLSDEINSAAEEIGTLFGEEMLVSDHHLPLPSLSKILTSNDPTEPDETT